MWIFFCFFSLMPTDCRSMFVRVYMCDVTFARTGFWKAEGEFHHPLRNISAETLKLIHTGASWNSFPPTHTHTHTSLQQPEIRLNHNVGDCDTYSKSLINTSQSYVQERQQGSWRIRCTPRITAKSPAGQARINALSKIMMMWVSCVPPSTP